MDTVESLQDSVSDPRSVAKAHRFVYDSVCPRAQNTTADILGQIFGQGRDISVQNVTSLPGNSGKYVGRGVLIGLRKRCESSVWRTPSAAERRGNDLKGCICPESQDQNRTLTVLYVPYSLDRGRRATLLLGTTARSVATTHLFDEVLGHDGSFRARVDHRHYVHSIHLLFLESQIPHKTVNLIFN